MLKAVHALYACAGIFEIGLLARPQAGELAVLILGFGNQSSFFFVEASFYQAGIVFPDGFYIYSYLAVMYCHCYGMPAVADADAQLGTVGQEGPSLGGVADLRHLVKDVPADEVIPEELVGNELLAATAEELLLQDALLLRGGKARYEGGYDLLGVGFDIGVE